MRYILRTAVLCNLRHMFCLYNTTNLRCYMSGLPNLWHAYPNWHSRRFFWHVPVTVVRISYPPTLLYIHKGGGILYDYYDHQVMMLRVNNFLIQTRNSEKSFVAKTGFLRMLSSVLFSLSDCNNSHNNNNIIVLYNTGQ
jgi:hypothetical protein